MKLPVLADTVIHRCLSKEILWTFGKTGGEAMLRLLFVHLCRSNEKFLWGFYVWNF